MLRTALAKSAALVLIALPGQAPAQAQPASAAAPTASADPHDLGGMWETAGFIPVVKDPPLLPAAQAKVDGYKAAQKAGKILYTAWTSCRPGAISTMVMPMNSLAIVQSPKEITILFEEPRMTRRIMLDGARPAKITPSYVGYSSGHWEGKTLVVETTGFNGGFEIDAYGLPTSPSLKTVERYTKSDDGQTISLQTEITDPVNYSRPFVINLKWKRSAKRHQLEYDCSENPRSEEFEHTLFISELYRPVCVAEQGVGMELSKIVCRKPEDVPTDKPK